MALTDEPTLIEPDEFVRIVARNIKSVLAQREVHAKDLADRIGMSETTLSQRMGGHNRWLGIELRRIARALNVDTDVLFAETDAEFAEALARSRWFWPSDQGTDGAASDPNQGSLFSPFLATAA